MPRPRLRLNLSVRTLVELVALVAAGIGFFRLHHDSQPPWPAIRALERGDEQRRLAALHTLIVQSDQSSEALPALRRAALADPSPAARRGVAHALMSLALDDRRPIALAGGTLRPTVPMPNTRSPLRAGADVAAMTLVEVMQTDNDPSVRVYALRSLRKVLTAAAIRRGLAASAKGLGAPGADPADGPWVLAATRAVVERTRDPVPEVRHHAVGFLVASAPAKQLLPPDEQLAALQAILRPDAPPLPMGLDLAVLTQVTLLMRPEHPDAPAWIDLVLRRAAQPPFPDVADRLPSPSSPFEVDAGEAYARILWNLLGSDDTLKAHPRVESYLIAQLRGDRGASAGLDYRIESLTRPTYVFTADAANYSQGVVSPRGTIVGGSWAGGLHRFPEPRRAASQAIRRDPRLLDRIWPALDREGQSSWLSDFGSPSGGDWKHILETFAAEGRRSERPPAECAAIVARSLAEPSPGAVEADRGPLFALARDMPRLGRPENPDLAVPPVDAARQVVEARLLAVLGFFGRGAGPSSVPVAQLVERSRRLLASPSPEARSLAVATLGSFGPAAAPALPELHRIVETDADEILRESARLAIGDITGTVPAADAGEAADAGP